MILHETPSPLANTACRIKAHVNHHQFQNFGGSEILIEDWWDRVAGKSWKQMTMTNPAALVYTLRLKDNPTTPQDDEVLYGKISGLGVLINIAELELK